ncbi:MAG: hypothetical protein J07HQW1_01236 [Haloquadratum walsbyi J07HQW1]|uniref:Uncharacterized protein n=1 Tax=Haloquadratum walsbyi J07HQW1 TaxID=1238424 RepID=U1MN20_9EURY|nr:MAG: hypothetical protein J07HQW1_01236 [Haloquadratum walsbyi J07HQW1]
MLDCWAGCIRIRPTVHSGETHVVSVVGRRLLVVNNAERVTVGLAGVLTVSKPVNVITDVVCGAFDNLLDEGRTQRVCFLTRVVVDTVLGFAVSDYAALVGGPLRPVCGLVHAVLEPVVGGVEAPCSRQTPQDGHKPLRVFPRRVCHGHGYSLVVVLNSARESAMLCSVGYFAERTHFLPLQGGGLAYQLLMIFVIRSCSRTHTQAFYVKSV